MSENNFYVYNTFFSEAFFDIDEGNKLKFKHDMSFGNDFLESWRPEWDEFLQYANDFRDALNKKHERISSKNVDEICADLIDKQRKFMQQGLKLFSKTERFWHLQREYCAHIYDVQERIDFLSSYLETEGEFIQSQIRDYEREIGKQLKNINKNKRKIDKYWRESKTVTSLEDISEEDMPPNTNDILLIGKNQKKYSDFASAFASQITLQLSNRSFIENFQYKYPKELEIPDKSIREILSDIDIRRENDFTKIKMVQKPKDAEIKKGMLNEVYQTQDGRFVKPGQLFINHNINDKIDGERVRQALRENRIYEKRPEQIFYSQNDSMGNLGVEREDVPSHMKLIDAKKVSVDSSSRQIMQNIIAKALGFEGLVVGTEIAIDNITGNVALMEGAKGIHGENVVLCKSEEEFSATKEYLGPRKDKTAILFTPELQIEFLKLGVLDYLCRQGDRHCGNFFIDPENNKVWGIDNDLVGEIGEKCLDKMERQLHNDIPFLTTSLKDYLKEKLDNPDFMTQIRQKLSGVFNGISYEQNITFTEKAISRFREYTTNKCDIIPDEELSDKTADRLIYNRDSYWFNTRFRFKGIEILAFQRQEQEQAKRKPKTEKPKNIAK